ncbi:MAG: putative baseplate assembly protein [Blastocatellia bacterium]
MSLAVDPTLRHLNDCECCEGVSAETPLNVYNRPGLTALAYRVGTHAQFRETLLTLISGSNLPALSRLTTRDNDDYSIALLDAWATVADVLTFYQERIANEVYLRTATERFSLLELARLISYQLRPGVSASTYLAFTLEDAPGALGQAFNVGTTAQLAPEPLPPIKINVGTKVQSVPGPGEQAQTYETVEDIEARVEWNSIKPRLTRPQNLLATAQSLILQGITANLKGGDSLLIADNTGTGAFKRILNVAIDDEAKTTRVDFVLPPPAFAGYVRPSGLAKGSINDFPTKVQLDEEVTRQIITKTWSEEDLSALVKIQGWPVQSLVANITRQTARRSTPANTGAFAFRERVAPFGHNAPRYSSLLNAKGGFIYSYDWDTNGWEIWKDPNNNTYYSAADFPDVYLERSLPGVVKGTLAVFERTAPTGTARVIYKIGEVGESSLAGFGISGKSTGLKLAKIGGGDLSNNTTDKPPGFTVRKTTVYIQSEQLALADLPIDDVVRDDTITLDRAYLGLKIGQTIILKGERDDLKGTFLSEARLLKDVIIEAGFTVVTFDKPLTYVYVRKTVTINANVASGTHGETVQEVLGSGDATQAFQRFTLRQPPLTFVSASNPSGAQTTLEVHVNDIIWHEVADFYGHGPQERIYITRNDDDGNTTITFGDGKTGARVPTGPENVRAKYRKGIGLAGAVKADQLTQLMTRPLGVKGVTNPTAASGAADSERLEEVRRNAPLTVLTLGRIVSLEDYEDFARAFGGVGKSLATWTWFGEKRGVFVTVAGAEGAEVKPDSKLYQNLSKAMLEAGDPTVPLIVASYQPRFFRIRAAVSLRPDFLQEKVFAEIEQKLRESFSFDARGFGQPVNLSEVVAVIQSIRGVVAVDMIEFYRTDETPQLSPRLEAAKPRPGDDKVFPAELLILDSRPLGLEVLQ